LPAKSYLFTRPPLWKSHHHGLERGLSVDLQSWLCETGSVTKRLRTIYGHDFGVRVLFHRWKPAFIDECRLLRLDPARYQLIREVLLHANGQPLVLARTILPEATIKIAHRNLSHLGSRPLGEVIFAYPDLELRQRQFSCVETSIWSSGLHADVWHRPNDLGTTHGICNRRAALAGSGVFSAEHAIASGDLIS